MSNSLKSKHSAGDRHHSNFASLFDQGIEDFFKSFSSHFPMPHNEKRAQDKQMGFVNPQVDITEDKEAFCISVELPGLDAEDIKLDLSNNVLTLSGEKKLESESHNEDKNVHVMERDYGLFQRSFKLPSSVEQDAIGADFEKGILQVRLPKSTTAQQQQRRINVAGK